MRRKTIAAAVAAAAIAGGALAVPAMASTSTPTPSKSATAAPFKGLTDAQQKELNDFLALHPNAGAALANRLDTWQKFADAHPAVVTELAKVAGMTPDQRKTELKTWAKAHPADAKAFHEFRQQVRDARKERRAELKKKIEERKAAKGSTGTATPTT